MATSVEIETPALFPAASMALQRLFYGYCSMATELSQG